MGRVARAPTSQSPRSVAPYALHVAIPVILANCELSATTLHSLSLVCKEFHQAARVEHPLTAAQVQNYSFNPTSLTRFTQQNPRLQQLAFHSVELDISQLEQVASLSSVQRLQLSNCTALADRKMMTRGSLGPKDVNWHAAIHVLSCMQQLKQLKLMGCAWVLNRKDTACIARMTWLDILDLRHSTLGSMGATRHLTALSRLRHLNIKYTDVPDITFLSCLTGLTFLDMTSCCQSHTKAFDQMWVLTALTGLKELILTHVSAVNRDTVHYLTHLTNLNALNLSGSGARLAGELLEYLVPLTGLTRLDLSNKCFFQWDVALDFIGLLTGLKVLKLGDYLRADISAISRLSNLKQLQLLTFWGRHPYTATIDQISHFTNLLHLDTHGSIASSDITMAPLSHLTRLTYLAVGGNTQLDCDTMSCLSDLTRLRQLDLCYCQSIAGDTLGHLSGLSNLQCLHLCSCPRVKSHSLKAISHLIGLKVLCLAHCYDVDAEGLVHVGKLTGLRGLYLCDVPGLGGRALQHLSRLTALEELDLARCQEVDSKALRHVGRLRCLEYLNLTGCRNVDTSGISQLVHLSRLRILILDYCSRIDSSAVDYLTTLRSLAELGLDECAGLSEKAVATLRAMSSMVELRYYKQHKWFNRRLAMVCGHIGRERRRVRRRLWEEFGGSSKYLQSLGWISVPE